jgi:sensor histidine kinase YesM
MTIMYAANFFLCGIMMSLMIAGIIISAITPDMEKWKRKFFIALFTILTLLVSTYLIDSFTLLCSNAAIAGRIAVFFEHFFIPVNIFMITIFLLHCCGENWRKSKFFYSVLIVYAVFLILLSITQFTGIFYYITDENIFYRNELHTILIGQLVVMSSINLIAVIKRRKILPKKYYIAFMVNTLSMTFAILFHTIIFNTLVVAIGITLSALGMFVIILIDHIEKFLRQQHEILGQQANILVLQMRPHFIYNTMTSIYYLCSQNPKQAQKVMLDFTNYLRKNFMAITHKGTILFSEELEHTKAYLSIEQAQFEENLFIEYDTPYVNFKIPPLTLQPIVENCIKHGLDLNSDPLNILILTRETESGNEIIVEDNGAGFELDDGRENFALKNIQKRLEMFCEGNLSIYPRECGGTIVKIFIPF